MSTQKATGTQKQGRLMTGAEIFVRSLVAEGVEVVFGYPGGATIGIYDALVDLSDIKHVLVRHEQGARCQEKAAAANKTLSMEINL